MSLVPSWAPNLHPLVIHFPIVLVFAAAFIDLVNVAFQRPAWLAPAATSLYAAGAVAAIVALLTGLQAASTVFIPGMAHPIIDDHRTWAIVTVWYFGLGAFVRAAGWHAGFPRTRSHRVVLVAVSLIGVVLVQQTAERGGRLVYEHGVGVIAAPGSR